MLVKEFLAKIEQNYNKLFPESKCEATLVNYLGIYIHVTCYLSKDITECSHHIIKNDMFSIFFTIEGKFKTLDDELTGIELNIENDRKFYWIKPEGNNAYGQTFLKFRKTKGDSDKIIKTLDRFFDQLKTSLLNDYKNNMIHNSYIELFKAKLGL